VFRATGDDSVYNSEIEAATTLFGLCIDDFKGYPQTEAPAEAWVNQMIIKLGSG
jgi:hypothetical protein